MNIIELLRKVGILRMGGGSYKGKGPGDYTTIDMDTSRARVHTDKKAGDTRKGGGGSAA